ncbi:MAG: sugar ABC transporter ATP-binding protein [bacterium]|nr:sugar ABC transporter ATP-binding protein [bacterium]
MTAVVSGGSIVIEGLHKRYGDTVALDGLDITVQPGEILGIAGPNGSGKSTMVKTLAGEVMADRGRILLDGAERDAAELAAQVTIVHQEPQVFLNLTVAENLLVGREHRKILNRRIDAAESELLADMGLSAHADTPLEHLPLAAQQRTEIARALAQDARIFLFDEPNSALTEEESEDLFRRMHDLANSGCLVILVSHRLHELVVHADRVGMIIDGQCRVILSGDDLTEERVARELVVGVAKGGEAGAQALKGDMAGARAGGEQDSVALRLSGWTHRDGGFSDIDMSVGLGEIVAISGVEGSGARALVHSLAGFAPATGSLRVGVDSTAEANGDGRSTKAATEQVGFVGANRAENLFFNLSVGENLLSRLTVDISDRLGLLHPRTMRDAANHLADQFQVKAGSVDDPMGSLSGGNQQKVVIGAATATRPKVLVLEEPTRGVDVGSKSEIYRLLRQYADPEGQLGLPGMEGHGEAVVLYCTEDAEIFEVADRVYVIAQGRISGELNLSDYDDVESFAADRVHLEAGG